MEPEDGHSQTWLARFRSSVRIRGCPWSGSRLALVVEVVVCAFHFTGAGRFVHWRWSAHIRFDHWHATRWLLAWLQRELVVEILVRLCTSHLTRRCSRRLAGLFPSFSMIKMLQDIASRALASRGWSWGR